jgi:hypothetical protein
MIFYLPRGSFRLFSLNKYVFGNFSVPPTDIPIEELQRDEAIDCQVCLILVQNLGLFFPFIRQLN